MKYQPLVSLVILAILWANYRVIHPAPALVICIALLIYQLVEFLYDCREKRAAIVEALRQAIASGVLKESRPEHTEVHRSHVTEALRAMFGEEPTDEEVEIAASKIPC